MTDMIPARSSEDVARGVLRVWVGGVEKSVPTLKIAASEKWVEQCGDKIGPFALSLAAEDSTAAFHAFSSMTQNAILDLVLAYDTTSALGGREWLTENADPEELFTALRQMGRVALPFVNFAGILGEILDQVERVLRSLAPTNGHLPTGASVATTSKRGSTASSSPPSGMPVRSA